MILFSLQIILIVLNFYQFNETFGQVYSHKTTDGKPCQIPFVYKKQIYHDCTTKDDERPWCYIDEKFRKWGYCINPTEEIASCSKTIPNITLDEIKEIVNEHNRFRATLPALRMRKLKWSNELAYKAQQAANKCLHEHVESNLCDDKRKTGQNLFYTYNNNFFPAAVSWTDIINSWSSEYKNYDMSTSTCETGKLCGHFTQVAWDKTAFIGCGKAACNGELLDDTRFSYLYYCNYYQPHTDIGVSPYQMTNGKKCQDCYLFDKTLKFQCDENQLCEICSGTTKGCTGLGDIKILMSSGAICADTNSNCLHNKNLCDEMKKGTILPQPIVEFLKDCKKTCQLCS